MKWPKTLSPEEMETCKKEWVLAGFPLYNPPWSNSDEIWVYDKSLKTFNIVVEYQLRGGVWVKRKEWHSDMA